MDKKTKVLVVDDEEEVRYTLEDLLTEHKFKVILAKNAKEALNVLKRQRIDIVISDLVMPKMGGRELSDKLDELKAKIKILFTSGYTDNHIVHDGRLMEGIEFIQKPYSTEALAKRIRKIFDK